MNGSTDLLEALAEADAFWEDESVAWVPIEGNAGCGETEILDEARVEIRHSWCQMCGPAKTYCSTLCRVRDGRWIGVSGNPHALNNGEHGSQSLCAKGNAAIQATYDPNRLMFPMRRTGAKGEGCFVRCSWDEAYCAIADKLAEVKNEHGPEALGVLSPQAYRVLWTLGRRFLNVYGSPNYLHSGICALQRAASRRITIGKATCEPGQLEKTKLYVVWGANPDNAEVSRGRCAAQLRAQGRGMKVVDIRPMLDPLASKADIWLPIRPGTDCALALAILHVIIGEELYDGEFVRAWCHGFDELAQHVRAYSPAWAASITGLSESSIVEVARLMGSVSPMAIHFGNGVGDQQSDGNWACVAICLIEAITGNLEVPGGGGAGVSYPPLVRTRKFDVLTERLSESEEDRACGYVAGVAKLVAPEMPRWYQGPKTWESGPNSAYFKALMSVLTEEPYPLRAVIGQASNPLSATRQPKLVAKALAKLDFYVVHDTVWNPSCDFADFVLPACTQYECSQQFGVKNGREGTFIGLNQQVIEPLGGSRSDWDFYLGLAMAIGYGDDFWRGDMDACLAEQLEGSGVSLEDLRGAPHGLFFERDSDRAEPVDHDARLHALFADLPFGKVQCANEWIGGKVDADETGVLGRLPVYSGPPEGSAETPELVHEYPLVFSDVHAFRFCNHGYYVGVPYLRAEQRYPWVKINPETAHRFGVADGDWVRVESPHGQARFVAEYFEGIAPGVLMARRGWWQPCDSLDQPGYSWADGGSEPSVLYNSDPSVFDPFHSAMPKQTLVRIESLGSAEGGTGLDDAGDAIIAVGAGAAAEGAGVVRGDGAFAASGEVFATDDAVPAVSDGDGSHCGCGKSRTGCAGFVASDSDGGDSGAFSFDERKCIGCKACVVACKQACGLAPIEETRRWVIDRVTGSFPQVKRSFLSQSCRHCASPACAKACPAQAISRCESGAVVVDKTRCVGCRRCAEACEYDVPRFASGVMDKCDYCVGVLGGRTEESSLSGYPQRAWRDEGDVCAQGSVGEGCAWGVVPPCVATCPTGALRFNFAVGPFMQSSAESSAR